MRDFSPALSYKQNCAADARFYCWRLIAGIGAGLVAGDLEQWMLARGVADGLAAH